jgi:putative ABC transport system ATP-binding protein
MDSARILLETQGIGRLAVRTRQWLLRDISLVVRPGERLAIVGSTGSGKTLLLRSLALLDPLDEGRILWRGEPVAARMVPDFRRQVIYLHQRPPLIEGTVEVNLRLPYTFAIHAHEAFNRNRTVAMLEGVGRGDLLRRNWRDLSGGESQIVALLRALQLEPTILLLDEPTASLDSDTALSIERLVLNWHQQTDHGRAVIWVTHDRAQSARVATRVLHMQSGGLVEGD